MDTLITLVMFVPMGIFFILFAFSMARDSLSKNKDQEAKIRKLYRDLDEKENEIKKQKSRQQHEFDEQEYSNMVTINTLKAEYEKKIRKQAIELNQEKEALARRIVSLEAEIKKQNSSPIKNDDKKHTQRIKVLENKLSKIESFYPDLDKLLQGQLSPAEYELVLIDKIPTYTIAGEVNNTPLTNFPINREPTVSHPPATFSWDRSVRTLYVNGKRQHRLDNALSEEIEKRFLSPVKIEIGKDTLSASVLIDPSTKREKESGPYTTTLSGCKCYDFEHTLKRNAACKHMFALALHLNLITENGDFVDYIPF